MSDQMLGMSSCQDCSAGSKPLVKFLHVDVTVICNLTCTYCYYSDFNNKKSLKQEVPLERLSEILDEAKSLGCERVIFSGGEVYASKKFRPLLVKSAEIGLKIIFITNGTLIKDEDILFLSSIRKSLHEIKVSFDGDNHDLIRGEGNGKKTIDTIERFDAACLPWAMNTILSELNYRSLPDLYRFLRERSPAAWHIDLPFLQGSFVDSKKFLEIADMDHLFRTLSDVIGSYIFDQPSFELWAFTIYRPRLEMRTFTKQARKLHPCTYNKRNLAVRGKGEVAPCSRFLHEMGNVKQEGLFEARLSDKFRDFWDIKIGDLADCQNCNYLFACGGGCRAHAVYEGNGMLGKDPTACIVMPMFQKYIVPLFSEATQNSFNSLLQENSSGGADDLGWKELPSIYQEILLDTLVYDRPQ